MAVARLASGLTRRSSCPGGVRSVGVSDFADLSDWDLYDLLRTASGSAATRSPWVEFVEEVPEDEAEAWREAARIEFRRRGYSDDEITKLDARDISPIQRRIERESDTEGTT